MNPSKRPRTSRGQLLGRSLSAISALIVALAVGSWFALDSRESREADRSLTPTSPTAEADSGNVRLLADEQMDLPGPERAQPGALENGVQRASYEKSFRGKGRITVEVNVPAGVEFPGYWQLIVEPARFLQGDEHAIRRELDFTRESHPPVRVGEHEQVIVEVDDLPLAGYRVSALAVDMSCTAQEIVLFKIAGEPRAPGRTQIRLSLQMRPAGFLDGTLIDHWGQPAEECLVSLEDDQRQLITVKTGSDGVYVFPSVPDGRYQLIIGPPAAPFLPRKQIDFKGPQVRIEEQHLPVLGSLLVVVTDELGRLLGEANVRGTGTGGTPIDEQTSAVGDVLIRYVKPGRYQLRATHTITERSGKQTVTVKGEERERLIELVTRP